MSRMATRSLHLVLLGLTAIAARPLPPRSSVPPRTFPILRRPVRHVRPGQLQRGYKVYKEVCSACHSMRSALPQSRRTRRARIHRGAGQGAGRDLQGQDGPRCIGRTCSTARPCPPIAFPRRFPMSRRHAPPMAGRCRPTCRSSPRRGPAGTAPLTLYTNQLIKGIGGPEYVYSVLTGYEEPPTELAAEAPEGKYYNPYFADGHWIAMPPPLSDGQVTYRRRHQGHSRPHGAGCIGLPCLGRPSRRWRSASAWASWSWSISPCSRCCSISSSADLGPA